MNFIVEYFVYNYDDLCFRCFSNYDNAIRFVNHNDNIRSYKIYRFSKFLVDYSKCI